MVLYDEVNPVVVGTTLGAIPEDGSSRAEPSVILRAKGKVTLIHFAAVPNEMKSSTRLHVRVDDDVDKDGEEKRITLLTNTPLMVDDRLLL